MESTEIVLQLPEPVSTSFCGQLLKVQREEEGGVFGRRFNFFVFYALILRVGHSFNGEDIPVIAINSDANSACPIHHCCPTQIQMIQPQNQKGQAKNLTLYQHL
jgi:hypothetical protein